MSQNFKLIMENWRRFKKINEDNEDNTEENEENEETEETNDDGEGGAAGEGGETPEGGEGGAAGEGGEGGAAGEGGERTPNFGRDTPPVDVDTANANADKEEKPDGTPADAGGVTDDATGEPVTDEFNASTASGKQIISQIQQMLVDGGFAPAEQPSGVNKGQPFADGQFGNLTYKALLRARKDQKIA